MNTIQSINGAELPISPTTDGYTVTVYDIDSENSNRSAETGLIFSTTIDSVEGSARTAPRIDCSASILCGNSLSVF